MKYVKLCILLTSFTSIVHCSSSSSSSSSAQTASRGSSSSSAAGAACTTATSFAPSKTAVETSTPAASAFSASSFNKKKEPVLLQKITKEQNSEDNSLAGFCVPKTLNRLLTTIGTMQITINDVTKTYTAWLQSTHYTTELSIHEHAYQALWNMRSNDLSTCSLLYARQLDIKDIFEACDRENISFKKTKRNYSLSNYVKYLKEKDSAK